MQPALYLMKFVGVADFGGGVLFIGNGKIVGMDIANLRFKGTYTEQSGRFVSSVNMTAPTGATLVTGQQLPAGTVLKLSTDWPLDFANGQQHPLLVEGRPVHVTFEKIDDIG
ncbi:hypothetical protein AB8A20_07990 [Tardiphaga sp. 604_B6_N1_1]|uniref:hypothetical protein n=1 Tax=unclassified Tardiphaga TaxID=2631404 RepID=UPI003F20161C